MSTAVRKLTHCVAIAFLAGLQGAAVSSEIIFQSATMGPQASSPNQNPSLSGQHLGVRFTVTRPVRVERIGGHVMGGPTYPGTVLVAIVPLEKDGLPIDPVGQAYPDVRSTAIVSTRLKLPLDKSAEVLGRVNVVLKPGTYGLVMGTDLFGRRGEHSGTMIANGKDIGEPQYFNWNSADDIWQDVKKSRGGQRFVIIGTYLR